VDILKEVTLVTGIMNIQEQIAENQQTSAFLLRGDECNFRWQIHRICTELKL